MEPFASMGNAYRTRNRDDRSAEEPGNRFSGLILSFAFRGFLFGTFALLEFSFSKPGSANDFLLDDTAAGGRNFDSLDYLLDNRSGTLYSQLGGAPYRKSCGKEN